ncbi:MATE family efflux transporter [Guptibacillus hwajinpoensis]|uniref:Probable multidrug resistance protein NorM n=1 Tax=Guptibacillus hwajinpoensis TaxID=208199 RepID=A0ABU0K1B9_9BACL|nr:MATE family efflux transporter [Alkalihalobacillus hemicentroti]MDQ0483153.1 MATE family multidrug resistance protein [Alkalihalobacillus hemicentroti]
MYPTQSLREKIKLLFIILYPILITQVGLYSMNFVDTIMSGRAGANDLAGVAIGSSLWVPVFTGLSGILLAITPIVSHYIGAKQQERVSFSVLQGIYLSIVLSLLILVAGSLIINPVLQLMDLNDSVRSIAKEYLIGLSFGIIPLFIYSVLRSFFDALGETRTTMLITLMSLPINVLFNYALIFGKFGFPELGGVGAGYASAITYWFILFISLFVVLKVRPFQGYAIFKKLHPISLSNWKEQLKIGVPIGFSIFFEVSIFAAVTLLMSMYTTETIAAHQAAINFASLLYMIPLSISMALTIAVGFEVGGRRLKDAKQYSYLGIAFALGMALLSALCLFIFNDTVALWYTTNETVFDLIKVFLIYAIFFQLSDAIAAPIQGALRGYKDVNVTLVMSLISYWIIGLPSGFLLAKYTAFGPYGYWVGLSAGLFVAAVTLFIRLRHVQKAKVLVSK